LIRISAAGGNGFDDPHIRDESVAAAGDGLHEPRTRRGIVQHIADSVDRFVDAVVEIHEGVGGPQTVAKLFPGHGLTRPFEQHRQKLKRLLLQSYRHAMFAQLAGSQINLEDAELQPGWSAGVGHEMTDRSIIASLPPRSVASISQRRIARNRQGSSELSGDPQSSD
jgi:hypothetical protein